MGAMYVSKEGGILPELACLHPLQAAMLGTDDCLDC